MTSGVFAEAEEYLRTPAVSGRPRLVLGEPMTKAGLLKVLRARLDDELAALGFRWRRMWRSSDGWYVREHDTGVERLGLAIIARAPSLTLAPFVTTSLTPVAELVCPHLGYVDAAAMNDFFDHNYNFSPFTQGPPGALYDERAVTNEDEARAATAEISRVLRDTIDPWLVAHRSPAAMFALLSSPWREAGPIRDPLRGMVEIALAHLTASPEAARLRAEALQRTVGWPSIEREKIERLVAALDVFSSPGSPR